MFKRLSSLENNYSLGSNPFNGKTNIYFKELNNLHLQQIACWSDSLSHSENFLKQELNINNLPNFNKGIIEKEFSFWRIEPLKWWIFNKNITLSPDLGTTLDLSHSFTCIHISGNHASLLLNRYLPIDLRESKFPELSSASSAIHHVSIKLFKHSRNNYYLLIPRGFALSIWEILIDTSRQFGYEVLDRSSSL